MVRTALSLGSNRVLHFVDGTRITPSSADRYRSLPPSIPPPELVLGEGGRYRAVVVIADPGRYPADGTGDWTRTDETTMTRLFDTPTTSRHSMGFVKKVRASAGGAPMCFVVVRVFGGIVSVLQRRLEIAMQHVNDHVGGTAPIVLYLMPDAPSAGGTGFGATLLPHVQLLGDTVGRDREVAVLVAPWPELFGGGCSALPIALDATGENTPNAPAFGGLAPGKRVVTVLTERRLRPAWQVCVSRARAEQHRYLEVPRELVVDRRFGRGYGRRVTEGTVRRLGLMQRIGALATGVVYSDDEDDGQGASRRSLAVLCQEAQRVVQLEQRDLGRFVGAKVRALLAAFRKETGPDASGVVPRDYALLLRANMDTTTLDVLVRNLGQQSEPALQLMDVRHVGEDLWLKLERVMNDVFPAALWQKIYAQVAQVLAYAQPAVDVFRDTTGNGTDDDRRKGNQLAVQIIGQLTAAVDEVLRLMGKDGRAITCTATAGKEVTEIAGQIGGLRARLGERPVVFTDIPQAINAQAQKTLALFQQLRSDCAHLALAIGKAGENPSDPGWVPLSGLAPVRFVLHAYGIGDPTANEECPFWFECAWMALNVALGAVKNAASDAFINTGEVIKVRRELERTFRLIDERTRSGVDQARRQAKSILETAAAAELRAPVNVSPDCLRHAVAVRDFFDGATTVPADGSTTNLRPLPGLRRSLTGLRIGIDSTASWARDAPNGAAITRAVDDGRQVASVLIRKARALHKDPKSATKKTARMRWRVLRNAVLKITPNQRDLIDAVAEVGTEYFFRDAFAAPKTQADASFNAIVLVASLREMHEWAAAFERDLSELFNERCGLISAMHDAVLQTTITQQTAGRLGEATVAPARHDWWLPVFGRVSFFTRRHPRTPGWFSFSFSIGLPNVPALRVGTLRGFRRRTLWDAAGRLFDWAIGDVSLPSMPSVSWSVRGLWRGLDLGGLWRSSARRRRRSGWDWGVDIGTARLFGRPWSWSWSWGGGPPGTGGRTKQGPDFAAARQSIGLRRSVPPRGWWPWTLGRSHRRSRADYLSALVDLDEFASLSARIAELGETVRGPAMRRGPRRRPRAATAAVGPRDLVVPLSALRLVVGPVLDGSPTTPGLFGPLVFPLVADLGRFERVVVLPSPIPFIQSVPGGDAVAWIEGCVARGGDVRLCFGQPGPRSYRPVALGGKAIIEPIAAEHDVRTNQVLHEPGTILVVRGGAASVGKLPRRDDDDMLVVTTSSLGWAPPKAGRQVRRLGVVAALAQ